MHTITDCMKQMRYQSCKADTDLWTKAVVTVGGSNQGCIIKTEGMPHTQMTVIVKNDALYNDT